MKSRLNSKLIAEFNKTDIGGIFGYNSLSHRKKIHIKRDRRTWYNMPKEWHEEQRRRLHQGAKETFCNTLGINGQELESILKNKNNQNQF